MTTKKNILILSRNYSNGLAIARMLGSVGYTVDMIASSFKEGASDVAKASKYIRNFSEIVSSKVGDEGTEDMLQEIMKHAGKNEQKTILIPTDDYTTSIMDSNRDKLTTYFEMPRIQGDKQGAITSLMNKKQQAEMAKEVGLTVPKNWVIDLKQDIIIPDDMEYPCYVKPIESIMGYKVEMAVCNNSSELLTHLEEMQKRFRDRVVFVQEYLNIDCEYASAGLCIDDKIILPGLIKKTRIGKHGTGVTLTGELVSLDEIGKETATKAISLLQKLRYTGMFGMEFAVCKDRIYFNEVNLRSAGESFAYYLNGVNLAELYIKAIEKIDFSSEEEKMKEFGKTFIYDKIAWDDYVRGYITKEELDECINSSNFAILINEDDPAPGKLFIEKQLAEKERREKNQKLREDCINTIINNTGWSKEIAEKELDEARKKTGIKYKQYQRLKMWELPKEEQELFYNDYLNSKSLKLNVGEDENLVIVLSRNYPTGLSIIRSLGSAGFIVDLIASENRIGNSEISAVSKYVRYHDEVLSGKSNMHGKFALLSKLYKYRRLKKKALLFPVDDYTAAFMDEFKEYLQDIFIMPSINNGKESIREYMDKTKQEQLARRGGMNVAKSWIFDLNKKIEIPTDMVYPCFCKPLESFSGTKSEIAKCRNHKELMLHLGNLQSRESKRCTLVQEFLNIDDEIDFSGLCLGEKVIIPAIIRKTRVAEHEKGVTLAGRVHPFEELDESVRKQIVDTLKQYNYFGMFDMELNIVGDKIYFNEVNLRSGGPNFAYFMSGVNLPAIFAKEAFGMGHSEEEEHVKEYGKTFVYDKVAWQDYAHRFISRKQLNELLNEADFCLLKNDEDPVPGELFYERKERTARTRRRKTYVRSLRLSSRPTLGPIKRKLLRYPQTIKSNDRKNDGEKPRVVITSRNYCSNLCMAKSIGEAGYPVEILRVHQVQPRFISRMNNIRPGAFSKYVKAYNICVTNRNPQVLVDRLIKLADKNRKMVLIPTDDLVAAIIDENMDVLRKYYYMPNINDTPGEVSKLMNKGYQKELARAYGIKTTDSKVIKTDKGRFTIPDGIKYPCFIKPNISKNAAKSKIRKCENEAELKQAIEEFSIKKDIEMLVEDYIEIKREFSLLGLSTKEGVVGPGFFVAEQGGQEEHRGVALKGRILDPDDYKELVDQLNGFVATLKFNGLFDIDLIETTSGEMHFVELNMRYGASGYAVTKCGVNLPAMFVEYLYNGTPIDLNCKITESDKTFVSEKVVIDEYRMDRITWEDVKTAMSSADYYFIKDENDPRPYKHFKTNYIAARYLRNKDRKRMVDEVEEEEE